MTTDGDPAECGEWEPIEHRFDNLPVHLALLHTGTVLVFGGTGNDETRLHDPAPAELFDPEAESWRALDSMRIDRLYHSGALLLPDGRVMMAGSNPRRRVNELRIETYRPPSLFRGLRPSIEADPDAVGYGEVFEIETPDTPGIDEVVLLRQCSTTHCLTTDQRLVELPILGRDGATLSTRVPANWNLLPPGVLPALRPPGGRALGSPVRPRRSPVVRRSVADASAPRT